MPLETNLLRRIEIEGRRTSLIAPDRSWFSLLVHSSEMGNVLCMLLWDAIDRRGMLKTAEARLVQAITYRWKQSCRDRSILKAEEPH